VVETGPQSAHFAPLLRQIGRGSNTRGQSVRRRGDSERAAAD
jgi:hypothetical protein